MKNNDNDFLFSTMGYSDGNSIIDINDDLIDISLMFNNVFNNMYNYNKSYLKNEIKMSAKNILNNFFKLHDVSYISERTLMFLYNNKMDILSNIKSYSKNISPFDIPICFSYESKLYKCLTSDDVYFSTICLDKYKLEFSIIIYIHEIIHTQLDSRKGLIKNYHNNEILPIFIELLSSFYLDEKGDLFRRAKLCRYENLSYCIKFIIDNYDDYDACVEASSYIVSTLCAFNLLDNYMFGNDGMKKEILNSIQLIFDGEMVLEDFLNKYNISIENSKKKILKIKI